MVDLANIDSFINYNFKPFNISECIKRLIVIWTLSIAICFIGDCSIIWASVFSTTNVGVTMIFTILIVKFKKSKIARFLCDGIHLLFCCYYIKFMLIQIFDFTN